jgi:hypothetical protein
MLFPVNPPVPATSIHQQRFAAKGDESGLVEVFSSNHGVHDPSENEELLLLVLRRGCRSKKGITLLAKSSLFLTT